MPQSFQMLAPVIEGKGVGSRAVEWVISLPTLCVFHPIKPRHVAFRKGFICHNSTASRTFPSERFWKCMALPSELHLSV